MIMMVKFVFRQTFWDQNDPFSGHIWSPKPFWWRRWVGVQARVHSRVLSIRVISITYPMVSRGKIVFIKTIFWNKNSPFRGYFRSIGPLFSRLHLVLSISIIQVGGCLNTYPSISGIKIVSITTFLGTQNDQFRGLFLVPRPSLIS